MMLAARNVPVGSALRLEAFGECGGPGRRNLRESADRFSQLVPESRRQGCSSITQAAISEFSRRTGDYSAAAVQGRDDGQ